MVTAMTRRWVLAVALLVAWGCDESTSNSGSDSGQVEGLRREVFVPEGALVDPVFMTQAPGDDRTFYIVEQAGRIRRFRDGVVQEPAWLDLREQITAGGERGLLGLAFHPDYPSNGRAFVYLTPTGSPSNAIAEVQRLPGEDRADEASLRYLFREEDPEANHNGGMLAFGPDGLLYAGVGDGGGAGDRHGPRGNAQNLLSPFGKVLRLDVDRAEEGFAAAANPFAAPGALPQIWAFGLRNPWRFAFDRSTGDLYIADVGQDAEEEINVQPSTSFGGENYGWRAFEGTQTFDAELAAEVANAVPPVLVLPHESEAATVRRACSVTGGYVYRGQAIEDLLGWYLYGDFCSGDIGALRWEGGRVVEEQRLESLEHEGIEAGLVSFAEDATGELYLVFLSAGRIDKIVQ